MNAIAKIETEPQQLSTRPPDLLTPVMNVALAKQRLEEFQEFIRGYLVPNEDYGIIPGCDRPTLKKPGAEKLAEVYGLSVDYIEHRSVIDWETGLFDYEIKCVLTKRSSGIPWASGIGSCSSYESKYRYRLAQRKCPICEKEAISKSKLEKGGGWYCNGKKGGCWAKFALDDKRISEQKVGQITNPDLIDTKNTVLKMAQKRALVAAVIASTRSSGIFTQDMEDLAPEEAQPTKEEQPQPEGKVEEPKKPPAKKTAKAIAQEIIKLLDHKAFSDKTRKAALQLIEVHKADLPWLEKNLNFANSSIAEFEAVNKPTITDADLPENLQPAEQPEFLPEEQNPYKTSYGKPSETAFGNRTGD